MADFNVEFEKNDFSVEFGKNDFSVEFKKNNFNVGFQSDDEHDPNFEEVFVVKEKEHAKTSKKRDVTLFADAWIGEGKRYTQVVNIEGVTANSQVDLTPDPDQLEIFYEKNITFVAEQENGIVTVTVIGQKPANDYTMQAKITEVDI